MIVWFVPEAVYAYQGLYAMFHLRRIAVGHYAGWDIMRYYAPSTDYRVFPDRDPGQDTAIHADLSSPLDYRSPHALKGVRASGMNIVRKPYPRPNENVVLNYGELRNIHVAMNLDIVAYRAAIVDDGVAPDPKIVPYSVLLPDEHIVPRLQIGADAAAGIDHAAASNTGVWANNQQDGTITIGRRVAQNYVHIDNSAAPKVRHRVVSASSYSGLIMVCHSIHLVALSAS